VLAAEDRRCHTSELSSRAGDTFGLPKPNVRLCGAQIAETGYFYTVGNDTAVMTNVRSVMGEISAKFANKMAVSRLVFPLAAFSTADDPELSVRAWDLR
jgi:hypothetical protein